jgi:hypothetical protein
MICLAYTSAESFATGRESVKIVQVPVRLVAKCAARQSYSAIMLAKMLATVKPVSSS